MRQAIAKTAKVTRREVAEMAGVSEATVSFVMSGKRYVSDELKDRVMKAIDTLGYYPDMIARAMSEKKSNSIAVLTNDLENPLQMKMIKSIEEAAMKKGFFVNICGGTMNLDRYVANLISRHIDGVFLAGDPYAITGSHMDQLLNNNISVALGTVSDKMDSRLCGVGLDFTEGMKIIIEFLRDLGHTKIAYLSAFDNKSGGDLRLSSFIRYMKECFGINNPILKTGMPPYESTVKAGYDLASSLIADKTEFTAIICTNDMMAFGAISALQQAGMRVPDDVSVVGIDDIIFSKTFYPALTTLSHKVEEFGAEVFRIICNNIADKSVVERKIITPELVVRNSTAPPRIK